MAAQAMSGRMASSTVRGKAAEASTASRPSTESVSVTAEQLDLVIPPEANQLNRGSF